MMLVIVVYLANKFSLSLSLSDTAARVKPRQERSLESMASVLPLRSPGTVYRRIFVYHWHYSFKHKLKTEHFGQHVRPLTVRPNNFLALLADSACPSVSVIVLLYVAAKRM